MDYELLESFEQLLNDRNRLLEQLRESFEAWSQISGGEITYEMFEDIVNMRTTAMAMMLDIEDILGALTDTDIGLFQDLDILTTEAKALARDVTEMLTEELGDEELAKTVVSSLLNQTVTVEEVIPVL